MLEGCGIINNIRQGIEWRMAGQDSLGFSFNSTLEGNFTVMKPKVVLRNSDSKGHHHIRTQAYKDVADCFSYP